MALYHYDGQYKCYLYPMSPISISIIDETTFQWKNAYNISFKLYRTDTPFLLKTDIKNPYYSDGFHFCQFQINESTNEIIRLIGPWSDAYEKIFENSKNIGENLYDGTFRNIIHRNSNSDCHNIEITSINNGVLYWRNQAGIIWTMRPTKNSNEFEVGEECPFYTKGFKICKLEFKDSKLMKLHGPNSEIYCRIENREDVKLKQLNTSKEKFEKPNKNRLEALILKTESDEANFNPENKMDLLLFEGFYERNSSFVESFVDEENKDWNFATIKLEEDGFLYWNNRAGRSWKLIPTGQEDIFEINDTCPFYEKGFTSCKFSFNINKAEKKNIVNVVMYDRKVFKRIEVGKKICRIF